MELGAKKSSVSNIFFIVKLCVVVRLTTATFHFISCSNLFIKIVGEFARMLTTYLIAFIPKMKESSALQNIEYNRSKINFGIKTYPIIAIRAKKKGRI